MNGLFQAGAFCGALGINIVADRWGRKMSIIVPSVLVLISGACLAGSVKVGMFITFRFFSGMGSWWLLGAVPVWMSEATPPQNRGVLVDCHSMALLFGYFLASWVGVGFYFSTRLRTISGEHLLPSSVCQYLLCSALYTGFPRVHVGFYRWTVPRRQSKSSESFMILTKLRSKCSRSEIRSR
jgi:MFS family permease